MTILYHDVEKGELFTKTNVLDNSANETFSMLGKLEDYRNIEGKFHLKICYPEWVSQSKINGKCCNEWKQTSNPVIETNMENNGFENISLAFTTNGLDKAWKGLGKSESPETYTRIDDTGNGNEWCMAVGAMKYEPQDEKYIPGPYDENKKKPLEVKFVKMLVRTGTVLFKSK